MSKKTMWLATDEYGEFVLCPDVGFTMTPTGWGMDGVFLNGGAYARKSQTKHRRGQATFTGSAEDVQEVLDFVSGQFGAGPFYMVDPFSFKNVLPSWLAAPRLMAQDAPSFLKTASGAQVRPTLTATPANAVRLPTQSALFTLNGTDVKQAFKFAVPAGYAAKVYWWGSSTGAAEFHVNGAALADDTASSEITTDTVEIALSGTSGTITISGIMVQLQKTGGAWVFTKFLSGRGTTQVSLTVSQYTGYSAIRERVSATVDVIEVGGWQ